MGVSPARSPKAKKQAESASPDLTCEYCHKSFSLEKTFLVHMCELKRRWLDQDTKYVKLGYMVYKRFYEVNYRHQKEKNFDDFMRSQFYSSFTKFGRYLLNIDAIRPKEFIEFLIKQGVKLDRWESPRTYEAYLRELNKRETPAAAIERNFMLMVQWGEETGENWTDFFRKISPALAVHYIQAGRISPWILFTASSAGDLIGRMSEEQLALVQKNIDPDFWGVKLKRAAEEVDFIRQQLDDAGL